MRKQSKITYYINIVNLIIIGIGIVIIVISYLMMYSFIFPISFVTNLELYSGESAFYPKHVIIVVAALSVFISILYIIHKIDQSKRNTTFEKFKCFLEKDVVKLVTEKFKENSEGENAVNELREKMKNTILCKGPIPVIGLDAGAMAGLGALTISLIGIFVTSFIQSPILDYDVVFNKNDNQYIIKINNYGNSPAHNVILTLEHHNLTFNNFKSNPFLSKHFISDFDVELIPVKGFVEIDVIPAFSKTDIIAEVNLSNVSYDNIFNMLKVNVRSDETVGKQNTIILISYYIPLLLSFLIIPILFWRGYICRSEKNFFRVILIIIIAAVLGSIIVSYYFRL